MSDCFLSERQKDLLRSIVPGFKDGTVKTTWQVQYVDEEDIVIWGLDDVELFQNHWYRKATDSDFDEFVICGFFVQKIGVQV